MKFAKPFLSYYMLDDKRVFHVCLILLQALEKAKEAGRKERVLVRQREQMSMGDQINLDLTYSVSTYIISQQVDVKGILVLPCDSIITRSYITWTPLSRGPI